MIDLEFTSQTVADVDLLKDCVRACVNRGAITFLEIGVFGGATARGIKRFCDQAGVSLRYCGVDNGSHPHFTDPTIGMQPTAPFPGAQMVIGKSSEVYMFTPEECDLVFVDGDHSFNGVILDAILYSERVRVGGMILFHDTAPHIQQTMREQYGPDYPRFYNDVLNGLQAIRWPFTGWSVYRISMDRTEKFGGITAYVRNA